MTSGASIPVRFRRPYDLVKQATDFGEPSGAAVSPIRRCNRAVADARETFVARAAHGMARARSLLEREERRITRRREADDRQVPPALQVARLLSAGLIFPSQAGILGSAPVIQRGDPCPTSRPQPSPPPTSALLAATAAHPRDNTILSLALGTGLRLGEIVGLNVGDVYFPDGTPRTRVRLRREIAKGGRAGDVFMPDALP